MPDGQHATMMTTFKIIYGFYGDPKPTRALLNLQDRDISQTKQHSHEFCRILCNSGTHPGPPNL